MIMVNCAGCGCEMDKQRDKVYLQKNYGKEEHYCQICNKVYYDWLAFKTDVFNKFDEEKKGVLEKGKKKIFGQKKQEPTPVKKVEVVAHNSNETIKSELSEIIEKGTKELTDGEIER